MTPERKAEIRALLNPGKPPKPKVVTSEGDVIRDAVVHVAPEDPNAKARNDRVVSVRRPGFVTINIAAWEEQQRWKREDRAKEGKNSTRSELGTGVRLPIHLAQADH